MEFNRIIKLLRKERGITQKQAAEDLGVSQALLSQHKKKNMCACYCAEYRNDMVRYSKKAHVLAGPMGQPGRGPNAYKTAFRFSI